MGEGFSDCGEMQGDDEVREIKEMPHKDPEIRRAYCNRTRSRKNALARQRVLTRHGLAIRMVAVARRGKYPSAITAKDILSSWPTDDKCPVFKVPFCYGLAEGKKRPFAPSLDRLNPAEGYTPSNIRIISWRANRLKSDATVAELKQILDWITKWAPIS